ncbi:MAG: hypothetical protein JXR87_01905 [Candidatus Marinimicrobia bacterium]|nr:hypothetical protein [Candidatus Neomarinimicrobiota bacterium]
MNLRSIIIPIIFVSLLNAAEQDFRGQLSLFGNAWKPNSIWYGGAGLQYIPNLQITNALSNARSIDFEASVYLYINNTRGEYSDDFKPYRLNLRYATQQSEVQAGLQQINFGPAQLLRSLMWFDRKDPTDPLNFSEGVWGLRYKYIFLNNANIWVWGLLSEKETKGYETMWSDKIRPEVGGRFQVPVPAGEIAVTAHHREIFINRSDSYPTDVPDRTYYDNRIALDGRWDIIVGAWFETVVQNIHGFGSDYFVKMSTLGMDYTFGIGNGLYVLAEHMVNQTATELFASDQEYQLSAVMANYPVGMFDTISLMAFYSWKTDDFIQYINWQRTYDKIAVNLALFHFPDTQFSIINTIGGDIGLRLMLIYNH